MSDQPYNDPTAPADVTPPPPPPSWTDSAPPPPPSAPVAPQVSTPATPSTPPAYQPPAAPAYQTPTAPVPPAYPPQGYAAPAPGVVPLNPAESRQWAMLAHVGGIILGFVGPLIVMLVFGPRDAFTRDQAVESLNFQITLLIGYIVGTILTAIIIVPVGLLVWVAGLVFAIMGALAANKGQTYRYPFALRLVK